MTADVSPAAPFVGAPGAELSRRRLTIGFLNWAHALDHFVILIYPTVVIELQAAYGRSYASLIALGTAGIVYVGPITLLIVALLTIVYFSYRQTIAAYPMGGGSYTVARENLGVAAGLLAAAALMIDYVLVVAVGISAGVGALVSAIPELQPYMLRLCLGILAAITLINLRGVRESGAIFAAPTIVPELSRTGDTVKEISSRRPSLCMRVVSYRSIRSPRRSLVRISVSSC